LFQDGRFCIWKLFTTVSIITNHLSKNEQRDGFSFTAVSRRALAQARNFTTPHAGSGLILFSHHPVHAGLPLGRGLWSEAGPHLFNCKRKTI
jgi:hypothetical protein